VSHSSKLFEFLADSISEERSECTSLKRAKTRTRDNQHFILLIKMDEEEQMRLAIQENLEENRRREEARRQEEQKRMVIIHLESLWTPIFIYYLLRKR
jgi:hypothetical protein